jgi:hypothetical protein
LEKAYGVFASEARALDTDYAPQTVNTDGWQATQGAWKALFPHITVILCFLHHVWPLGEVLLFRVPPWPQPVGV